MSVVVEDALAQALRVLQETTENVDGASFVEALVRGLAQAFAAEFTLMGEVDADDPSILRPLAAWARGTPTVLAPYRIEGTPCAEVIVGGEICVFPRGVQGCFPGDRVLAEIGGESYLGVAVRGRDGQIVGLLAAIDSAPRPDFVALAPALVAFAAKAAWMIERGRLELHLRRSLARSRALTRIATNLHAALVWPDEAFQQMCGEVRTVLDVSAVSVTLIDVQGRLDRRAQVGLPQAWLDDPPPVSVQWLEDNLPAGEVVIFGRDALAAYGPESMVRRVGLSWTAAVALRHEGLLVGLITALQFGGDRVLTPEDHAWLAAVAGLLGQVVDAGRLLEALRRSEQRYRRIVTTTHEGVWTVDAQQRATFVNQRMADMSAIRSEEMIGHPLHDFVPPEDHALITAKFAERRARGARALRAPISAQGRLACDGAGVGEPAARRWGGVRGRAGDGPRRDGAAAPRSAYVACAEAREPGCAGRGASPTTSTICWWGSSATWGSRAASSRKVHRRSACCRTRSWRRCGRRT
jgi:PAS domain-containing protein